MQPDDQSVVGKGRSMEGVYGEVQGRSRTETLKAQKNALVPIAIASRQHDEDRGVPAYRTGFSLLANAPSGTAIGDIYAQTFGAQVGRKATADAPLLLFESADADLAATVYVQDMNILDRQTQSG